MSMREGRGRRKTGAAVGEALEKDPIALYNGISRVGHLKSNHMVHMTMADVQQPCTVIISCLIFTWIKIIRIIHL